MTDWQHAPAHRFEEGNTFFITGATYRKQRFYGDADALTRLNAILFAKARLHSCLLQSWALLSNHYHVVVQSERGENVRTMISRFHTEAAIEINRRDGVRGRQVWYQFWDKTLTFEGSWLARLKYTNENAVHHGLVLNAAQYPWCSAAWFERTVPRKFADTVRLLKVDQIRVYDDFECV